jgi:hypothetical protein
MRKPLNHRFGGFVVPPVGRLSNLIFAPTKEEKAVLEAASGFLTVI